MAAIRVTIDEVGISTHRVELPNDVAIERLLPALLSRLDRPVIDSYESPIGYRLYLNQTELGPDLTLAQCGVKDGDTLFLCSERLASRPEQVSIFYSYSHKDEDLRSELNAHLAALRRSGLIAEWHDRKIVAGQDWNKEISKHLDSAKLILFLISADFISSSYISDVEVRRALDRQNAGDAVVVPVILRPVMWQVIPEFSRLQALPEGARPVTMWPSHDLAFLSICEGIFAVVLSWACPAERKAQVSHSAFSHGLRRASRSRRRVLDAALPARVPTGKPSTLLVMIRMADSLGLRAVVESDADFGMSAKNVDSQPLTLTFPVDDKGRPQPLDLTIRIEAPQFEPTSQVKSITVPPTGDSAHRIFLLTPTQVGKLLVNLGVYRGDELLMERLLRTQGVRFEEEQPPPQCVVSVLLPVSASEEEYPEHAGMLHFETMEVHHPRTERRVRIALFDQLGSTATNMEMPDDVEVARLVPAMVRRMGLAEGALIADALSPIKTTGVGSEGIPPAFANSPPNFFGKRHRFLSASESGSFVRARQSQTLCQDDPAQSN